jgi:hypothetical protein
LATAVAALAGALIFGVAGALADAGNPITGTISAQITNQTATTVTISVKGEWNWLSHTSDCNTDRAATGAAIAWGDRNGADNTRTISSISRATNVVTVTTATQAWNVGDRVTISGNASFNGGPFTVTAVSGTTIKYNQTGANATSSGGTVLDRDVFNGWRLYKSSTSYAYLGTATAVAGNPIDREAHPTDVGNVPADGHGPLPGDSRRRAECDDRPRHVHDMEGWLRTRAHLCVGSSDHRGHRERLEGRHADTWRDG